MPGFIEMASKFFDSIFLADCSMDMKPSTDGTLDIIRKWGLPDPPLWNLSDGFGAVRSQLVHSSPSDWTVIMDIDERMEVCMPVISCEGNDRYPAQEHPDLTVVQLESVYNQREFLMSKIMEAERRGLKAIRFSRRHWFDMTMTRPCENWTIIRDFQLRCMKSRSGIGYTTKPRMHERAFDFDLNREPWFVKDDPRYGPFLDHYHCHFKPMEPDQRKADIVAYDALHKSDTHTPIPTCNSAR